MRWNKRCLSTRVAKPSGTTKVVASDKMESLKAGNHITGPAIIESDATTFVVPEGFATRVDKHRLFHLIEVK